VLQLCGIKAHAIGQHQPTHLSSPPSSKFDNRLKEFAERWEVDRYLAATGYLPPSVKPFFVALPKVKAEGDVAQGLLPPAGVPGRGGQRCVRCKARQSLLAHLESCNTCSLPQDRQLQGSAEWRRQMADVDRAVFSHLRDGVKGGFDEDHFGSRIGFGNLKRCAAPLAFGHAGRREIARNR
jgi:hypothetical protein